MNIFNKEAGEDEEEKKQLTPDSSISEPVNIQINQYPQDNSIEGTRYGIDLADFFRKYHMKAQKANILPSLDRGKYVKIISIVKKKKYIKF